MWKSILAITLGAALGAIVRWQLGLKFNNLFPNLPIGTLAANLVGGYLVGVCIAYFTFSSGVSPEWKLFWVTGLCGGLTTFSTFSTEVVTLIQEGRFSWAVGAIALHVIGSLVMTLVGLASARWVIV